MDYIKMGQPRGKLKVFMSVCRTVRLREGNYLREEKRVSIDRWYPPDYPVHKLNPWRSLRRFWSCSFALGDYPTYCMYRRGLIV